MKRILLLMCLALVLAGCATPAPSFDVNDAGLFPPLPTAAHIGPDHVPN